MCKLYVYPNRLVILLLLLPLFVVAVDYPVGVSNCGISSWYQKAPERAVTLNQGTTEIMLALGLADRMVGTAYLDDEIWPELADDYNKVPVIASAYPEANELFKLNPDFLYASYSSAFATSHINYTTVVGDECDLAIQRSDNSIRYHCRQELQDLNIQTYLQTPFCELVEHRSDSSLGELRQEIWTIATIFDVLDNGQTLVDSIQNHFEKALSVTQAANSAANPSPITVLWLDGLNNEGEDPYVGACCGAVQTILDHAGAKNVFEGLGVTEKKSWDKVTWAEIEAKDPDLIVLVDASWDMASEKLKHMCGHPIASKLRAVQERAFLTVPFSGSTLGVRVGSLAYNLAEAFVALARGTPLPAIDFSSITIPSTHGGGSQAVTRSGVKVYTKLPVYESVDLDSFCPGSSDLQIKNITDDSDKNLITDGDDGLPSWAVPLIVILSIVVVALVVIFGVVVANEKKGNPLFQPVLQNADAELEEQ